jgi:crotonobetainyl-CoA:carnitine CoA-transferase CaiB-like acyl-CoA transferase
MIDQTTAMYAVIAILACLQERERTGKGKRIDVCLLDTAVTAMSHYVIYNSFSGKIPARSGSGVAAWFPYQAFDTKDNPIWVGVSVDKFWVAFCKALNLEKLAAEPRFATVQERLKNKEELGTLIAEIFSRMSSKEIEIKLAAAGVPCARLLNVGEVSSDPQVQYRQLIEEMDYPGLGHIRTVKTPIMVDGEFPPTRLRAPLLGEHTVDILKELGYRDSQIDDLVKKGVAKQSKSK